MTSTAQHWNADIYNRNAAFVSAYGEDLIDWLDPSEGEQILDLGCGEGTLALQLMKMGPHVVGIDVSEDMVKAAQLKGVEAYVMDASDLSYEDEFDAVFSNAVLHWLKPPEKALQAIYRALKPGGRIVAEFGGYGNIATIQKALMLSVSKRGVDAGVLNPWYFPQPEEYVEILEAQGFRVECCIPFDRPTALPTGIKGWLETFAGPFLAPFTPSEAAEIIEEVSAKVQPVLCNPKGEWFADYVRLRFKAVKPEV